MGVQTTKRFLAAYNALDDTLRRRFVNGDHKVSHAELISQLAKADTFGQQVASRLHAFRTLRNALVHMSGTDAGEPIATPLAAIVEEYERLVAYLQHPPPALAAIAIPAEALFSVPWSARVAPTIDIMLRESFRLVPIVSEGRLVGVFTESTLWQALCANGGRVEVTEDMTFEAFAVWCTADRGVLGVVLLPDSVSVHEVERVFQARFARNEFTSAVFLTVDGTVRTPLRGLITAHDLPSVNPHASQSMLDRFAGEPR